MPYFLSDSKLAVGRPFDISGEEAGHILLSRRAKVGDKIKIQGADGKRFLCALVKIGKHQANLEPLEEIIVPAEPAVKIVLYQSVVALNTLDAILQKATELGVSEIVLFNSQFTAAHLSKEKFDQRYSRFQKILWEAAKQSERARVPNLKYLSATEGILSNAASLDKLFVFDVSGHKLKAESKKMQVGLVIGPEGGLSQDELKVFSSLPNAEKISLGSFLLKADTAAVVAISLLANL